MASVVSLVETNVHSSLRFPAQDSFSSCTASLKLHQAFRIRYGSGGALFVVSRGGAGKTFNPTESSPKETSNDDTDQRHAFLKRILCDVLVGALFSSYHAVGLEKHSIRQNHHPSRRQTTTQIRDMNFSSDSFADRDMNISSDSFADRDMNFSNESFAINASAAAPVSSESPPAAASPAQPGVIATVAALAIAGNLIILVATRRRETFPSSSRLFIASIACSDLLLGLALAAMVKPAESGEWVYSETAARATAVITHASSTMTFAALAGLNLDRYMALKNNGEGISHKKTCGFLLTAWTDTRAYTANPIHKVQNIITV
ncbi:hypothetical protein Bbelb_311720 [Branchiostoma belcheri]|nr:hypothetical protein Bbelb_311720 [Branchiostoma belcheri]